MPKWICDLSTHKWVERAFVKDTSELAKVSRMLGTSYLECTRCGERDYRRVYEPAPLTDLSRWMKEGKLPGDER